jgi:NAD(P)-dependent dehydrogenase (short-subunit alcohol dehydrogenase family)
LQRRLYAAIKAEVLILTRIKAEVVILTRRFAMELGPDGITVNAVAQSSSFPPEGRLADARLRTNVTRLSLQSRCADSLDHLVGAAEQRSGTVMPSALAVLKLMISSTFVD